jgi:2-methylfumaryl-CoA isomerase
LQALSSSLGLDLGAEGNRFRAREHIAALVGPWIRERSLAQVASAFDARGVCWSRYQSVAQLVQSDPACSEANTMFSTVDQPGVGRCLVPGLPLSFSAIQRTPARPAPRLGQHTEEVLAGVLGLGSAELGRLFDQRVIGRPAGEGHG